MIVEVKTEDDDVVVSVMAKDEDDQVVVPVKTEDEDDEEVAPAEAEFGSMILNLLLVNAGDVLPGLNITKKA